MALLAEGLCFALSCCLSRAPKGQAGLEEEKCHLLSPSLAFPPQERRLESNTEKEAPANAGIIKQVEEMVGFWRFN